jgi:hypothetical protein
MEILYHLNVTIPDDQWERYAASIDLDTPMEEWRQDDLTAIAEAMMEDDRTTWMDHVALAEINIYPADEPEPTHDLANPFRADIIRRAVERSKAEILQDIGDGRVAEDVPNFSALHDYVDANTYGGLCDGDWPTYVADDGQEHLDIVMANEVQEQVDAWLKAGRP